MADFVSKITIFDKKRKIQLGSEYVVSTLVCKMSRPTFWLDPDIEF